MTVSTPPPAEPDAAKPRLAARRAVTAATLADGVATIQAHLKTLPNAPGVYRMLDAAGEALYVGKAKNLRRRVNAYTLTGKHPARLLRMIAETTAMEFVVTKSEVEALLLEANLIKRLRPRYNVLLRDDKTFPHILIAADHEFPQLAKHRGARKRPGRYFGPFASAGAVNRTITALQRAFLLRNCPDTVFSSRTRPCLQYQIKRCTAPCVGHVDKAAYANQVEQATAFLSGHSQSVQGRLAADMMAAADQLDFESAARLRDRVKALAAIQAHQDINAETLGDADALAAYQAGGQTCIQVYFFRGGRNYGTRAYFPSHDKQLEMEAVLTAFIGQFYDNKPAPRLVLLSHTLPEAGLIEEALSLNAGHRVGLAVPRRGDKRRLIDHALDNAREALARRMAAGSSQQRLLEGLARALGLEAPPQRVEVFDNSHIAGTDAIGAMIVAGPDGFLKNAYRKFTIKRAIAPGDDYAMMREVLTRRFARAVREDPDKSKGVWPDLVLIDGGQGQLGIAEEVMADLGIVDQPVVAIAKGPDRNAGRERLFVPGRGPFSLEPRDPVLYFLQRLRDEAHRFAIGTHRARRAKQVGRSPIDEIAGIGPRRKKALLLHFGSAREVSRASLKDLQAVDGISGSVAKKIHDHFNPDS
ncbi:MAG: excinuclease ABC subunit UvrC [Inquilinus sp.]|nr:excinuclease ABC subunit UvrC [Inquilinus sp.]